MAECSSPVNLSPVPDSIEVSLLEVGEEILEYVVPSFPVFFCRSEAYQIHETY